MRPSSRASASEAMMRMRQSAVDARYVDHRIATEAHYTPERARTMQLVHLKCTHRTRAGGVCKHSGTHVVDGRNMCTQHRRMHENGGRMPRRVPKADMPRHAFDIKNVIILDSTECTICFENMDQKDMVLTNCGHVYHKHCLEAWQRRNPECPQCKRKTNALRTTGQRLNLALRLTPGAFA